MSNRGLFALVGGFVGVFVANYLYWQQRLDEAVSRVRESYRYDTEYSKPSRESRTNRPLLRAAENAGVPPEELPEWVGQQGERIAELTSQQRKIRQRWADAWWRAAQMEAVDPSSPRELVVVSDEFEMDDVAELAKLTVQQEWVVAFVGASQDGSFAVTVGKERRDERSATELAERVTRRHGGGAGGSESFATGRTKSENLRELLQSVSADLD